MGTYEFDERRARDEIKNYSQSRRLSTVIVYHSTVIRYSLHF
jgi:hypothetical protein